MGWRGEIICGFQIGKASRHCWVARARSGGRVMQGGIFFMQGYVGH